MINLVGGYFFTVHLSSYERMSLCKCKCKCNNKIYSEFRLHGAFPMSVFGVLKLGPTVTVYILK